MRVGQWSVRRWGAVVGAIALTAGGVQVLATDVADAATVVTSFSALQSGFVNGATVQLGTNITVTDGSRLIVPSGPV